MEIEINGQKTKLRPLDERKSKFFADNKTAFRATARHVYDWDCTNPGGNPKPRPKTMTLDADALFLIDDTMWKAYGIHGHRATLEKQALADALKAYKLKSPTQLQAQINKTFPPRKITIPYGKLVDPWLPGKSVILSITENYVRWYAEHPAGGMNAPYFIQVPVSYQFQSQVVHVCDGDTPKAKHMIRSKGGELKLTDHIEGLIKEHTEALKKTD